MSIKKLFVDEKITKVITNKTGKDLGDEAESERNIKFKLSKKDRFLPHVVYSPASSSHFAKYGSAEKYYEAAMTRITDNYPYDGTEAEKTEWENKSTQLDLYVFENLYPRTNGYAQLCSTTSGWGLHSATGIVSEYGHPASNEYIQLRGGPHTGSAESLKQHFEFHKQGVASNIYKTYSSLSSSTGGESGYGSRESNLKTDLDNLGVTVEFWMKKPAFQTSKTVKEVIFDMWNGNAIANTGAGGDYGRLLIELKGDATGTPFLLTCVSGATGFTSQTIGENVTTTTVQDWNHYAFSFKNSGSKVRTRLYVNGILNQERELGTSVMEITGSLIANIGALRSTPIAGALIYQGGGKLSASLDEFRYWNVERDIKQVGQYWWTQYGGGTNTDIANSSLGVYYKFNEGKTEDNSVDRVVLDYSGRLSNGYWVGYPGTTARASGSAIKESGASATEFEDPIIYSTHPEVTNLKSNLMTTGSAWDQDNNTLLFNSLPSWIVNYQENKSLNPGATFIRNDLHNLVQVIASYFDTLQMQVSSLNRLKHVVYPSSSAKPLPFAEKLLEHYGMPATEMFANARVLEKIMDRTDHLAFEQELVDTKNLIYQNIYNNLVGIYKSKGTEKSFRNLFRCFGVDDQLIKLNLYGDNITYELKDNHKAVSKKRKYANFYVDGYFDATVFQTSSAGNANSVSYITGSDDLSKEPHLGAAMETEVFFSARPPKTSTGYIKNRHTNISLFGLHTVGPDPVEYTIPSNDYANFQVLAIKTGSLGGESKDVYFKITSSSPHPIPELTSSVFQDVYDNERWNFSVRIKPSKYDYTNAVTTGSTSDTYNLEFQGVNTLLGTIQNQFLLTASVTNEVATNFLKSSKRVYAGSQRQNFTGSILYYSDAEISAVKYWTAYVPENSFLAHAKDLDNYGSENPLQNPVWKLNATGTNAHTPQIKTLALNWDFHTVTGSDSSGEFMVADASSGSVSVDAYGTVGQLSNKQHLGKGYGFKASSADGIRKRYINSAKQMLPEVLSSDDMIEIRRQDDVQFTREHRPIKHYFAIEKSMYQNISEEMLNMFATIVDFNNIIGAPVHRYRGEYKDLEKLRQIFFEKVSNTPDLDRYLDFYKWIDQSINDLIHALIPASAQSTEGLQTVVESHVLERSKYRNKYPTLEMGDKPVHGIRGINELLYSWRASHDDQAANRVNQSSCHWWTERVERDSGNALITSGDSEADTDREALRQVIGRHRVEGRNVSTTGGTNYEGSTFACSRFTKPFRFLMENCVEIRGGSNSAKVKSLEIVRNATHPHGDDSENGFPYNVILYDDTFCEFGPEQDPNLDSSRGVQGRSRLTNRDLNARCTDGLATDASYPHGKKKYSFSARIYKVFGDTLSSLNSDDALGTYEGNMKGAIAAPFSIYHAGIGTERIEDPVHRTIDAHFKKKVTITNLHEDAYGSNEIPMQGPFTSAHVGGRQSRHVPLNLSSSTGLDTEDTRPEAWRLLFGPDAETAASIPAFFGSIINQRMLGLVGPDYPFPLASGSSIPTTHRPRATLWRGSGTKRPVNIQNLKFSTGSVLIGNYKKEHEIVQIPGRHINNRALIEALTSEEPNKTQFIQQISASAFTSEVSEYIKPSRGRNEHVFVSRFSAPGGPDQAGDSDGGFGLELESAQFSPYNTNNYRNLIIRGGGRWPDGIRELLTNHTRQFGYYSDHMNVSNGADDDRRFDASVNALDYTGRANYHKTNRNSGIKIDPYNITCTTTTTDWNLKAMSFPLSLGHAGDAVGACESYLELHIPETGRIKNLDQDPAGGGSLDYEALTDHSNPGTWAYSTWIRPTGSLQSGNSEGPYSGENRMLFSLGSKIWRHRMIWYDPDGYLYYYCTYEPELLEIFEGDRQPDHYGSQTRGFSAEDMSFSIQRAVEIIAEDPKNENVDPAAAAKAAQWWASNIGSVGHTAEVMFTRQLGSDQAVSQQEMDYECGQGGRSLTSQPGQYYMYRFSSGLWKTSQPVVVGLTEGSTRAWQHVVLSHGGPGNMSAGDPNTWFVANPTDPEFWVNGQKKAVTRILTPITVPNVPCDRSIIGAATKPDVGVDLRNMSILGSSLNYQSFHGYMDEISIYDQRLSPNAIAALYPHSHTTPTHEGPPNDILQINSELRRHCAIWYRAGDGGGVLDTSYASDKIDGSGTGAKKVDSGTASGFSRDDAIITNVVYDITSLYGKTHAIPAGAAQNVSSVSTSWVDVSRDQSDLTIQIPGAQYEVETVCTYASSSFFDNWYVTHEIPRSESQYTWISSSIQRDPFGTPMDGNGYGAWGHPTAEGLVQAASSSVENPTYVEALRFVSASSVGSAVNSNLGNRIFGPDWKASSAYSYIEFQPTDFVRLNTNVYEPLTQSTNTLGYPLSTDTYEYKNAYTADTWSTAGEATLLHQLIHHRQGPYGWPSWKQIRGYEHPARMAEIRGSRLTIVTNPEEKLILIPYDTRTFAGQTRTKHFSKRIKNISHGPNVVTYNEPAIVNNCPMTHVINERTTLVHPYRNTFCMYTNQAINNQMGIEQSRPTMYSALVEQYSQTDSSVTFNYLSYCEPVYPKETNRYRELVRRRDNFDQVQGFWDKSRASRRPTVIYSGYTVATDARVVSPTSEDQYRNSQGMPLAGTSDGLDRQTYHSRWVLDASEDILTETYSYTDNWPIMESQQEVAGAIAGSTVTADNAGELMQYHGQIRGHIKKITTSAVNPASLVPHAQYGRRHTIAPSSSADSLSGEVSGSLKFGSLAVSAASYRYFVDLGASTDPEGPIPMFGGENMFETALQSGKYPSYNNYDEYSQSDIWLKGKDYSIVPEFRISEHMDYYVKRMGGNFLADNTGSFTLQGASFAGSAEEEFYTTYSHSDFMKQFDIVDKDHAFTGGPSSIELKCKGILKLLPYEGFYPAQRTTQLASLFSQSYGSQLDILEGTGYSSNNYGISDAAGTTTAEREQSAMWAVYLRPFFAPGIMFNTIKSGVAVDYPIMTGDYKIAKDPLTTVLSQDTWGRSNFASKNTNTGWQITEPAFHDRVPFEAIIEPEKYIIDLPITNMEPHPSGSYQLSLTGALKSAGDSRYRMAANNFFAEVPEFFLHEGSFSALASLPESDPEFGVVTEDKCYAALVKLRKSTTGDMTLNAFTSSQSSLGACPYNPDAFTKTPSSITSHVPTPWTLGEETITMYSRPSAFGPPTAGGWGSSAGINMPFTPPYYDGEAWAIMMFNPPNGTGEYTLDQILANTTIEYTRAGKVQAGCMPHTTPGGSPAIRAGTTQNWPWSRPIDFTDGNLDTDTSFEYGDGQELDLGSVFNFLDPYPQGRDFIDYNAMQLSASCNLKQKAQIKASQYNAISGRPTTLEDEPTANLSTWIIQTKFETPILNFKDCSINRPAYSPETAAKGMWHQYGEYPRDEQVGVFLEISDVPKRFIRNGLGGTPASTGSLADLVGFSTKPVKLGKPASSKTISEAVVAVPFLEENGERLFFEVNRPDITQARIQLSLAGETAPGSQRSIGIGPGDSVVDMVDKMQRYVFPPRMDFLNNTDIQPFSMYIFEFSVELGEKDLTDIWQNVLPDIGRSFQEQTVTVSHPLLVNELMGAQAEVTGNKIQDKLQWMVFKVKQKARTSYYEKVMGEQVVSTPSAGAAWPFSTAGSKPITTLRAGTIQKAGGSAGEDDYPYSYNWPYDYFSLVELVKIDAAVNYGSIPEIEKATDILLRMTGSTSLWQARNSRKKL